MSPIPKVKIGDDQFDTLDEKETRKIVGEELDSRFSKLEIPKALDEDAFKKSILDEVTSLFESHKTEPLSQKDLTKTIETVFDSKMPNFLKGIAGNNTKEKEPGFLSKFLTN